MIFLPEKINVGYQERSGTYTGKLAYIIYYDNKGVLRKEKSWNGWRDNKIEPTIFENIPTDGFVLNKKTGGYSTGWNHRQTYCRVYDSRGFEFEITLDNLLYILENTNSVVGKGLEGEFVYGWSGKDLILIPCDSPDYKEISKHNSAVRNKTHFKGKDLIIGATYITTNKKEIIYIGRYQQYDETNKEKNEYFFQEKDVDLNKEHYSYYSSWSKDRYNPHYTIIKSLSKEIMDVVDENCIDNYADRLQKVLDSEVISFRDKKKDEYKPYTKEDFVECFSRYHPKDSDGKEQSYLQFPNGKVFIESEGSFKELKVEFKESRNGYSSWNRYPSRDTYYTLELKQYSYRDEWMDSPNKSNTLEELYDKIQPHYLIAYDKDGKLIKEFKNDK